MWGQDFILPPAFSEPPHDAGQKPGGRMKS
jgi:hypothetical protein